MIGLMPCWLACLVEINRPVKHPVVGHRQRGELQLVRLLHQPVQPASPIEQRILGVQMKMDKFRVRHGSSLRRDNRAGQAATEAAARCGAAWLPCRSAPVLGRSNARKQWA